MTHPPTDCAGRACAIHAPSDHHMREWPRVLRASGLIERTCPHGVGHPDPDSLAWLDDVAPGHGLAVHGCDGCCGVPS